MNPWFKCLRNAHFLCNIHPFLSIIVILKVFQSFSYDSLIMLNIGNISSLHSTTKSHDHLPDFCTTFYCETAKWNLSPNVLHCSLLSTAGGLTNTNSICSPIWRLISHNTTPSKTICTLMLKGTLTIYKTYLIMMWRRSDIFRRKFTKYWNRHLQEFPKCNWEANSAKKTINTMTEQWDVYVI